MIELAIDKPMDDTINPLSFARSSIFSMLCSKIDGTEFRSKWTKHFDQCHDCNDNGIDSKDFRSEVSRQEPGDDQSQTTIQDAGTKDDATT